MLRKLLFLIVLSTTILLGACDSNNITQKNFDKIKNGMTQAQVEKILGQPTSHNSTGMQQLTGTAVIWKSDRKTIFIQFVNNKVALKTFVENEPK